MAERQIFDVLVIGGGINGCGIARDAVGRGYSVLLAEMGDFASGTSSASTKLIHGGLRYLEYYEFRLVHEALVEREILWALAPHVIRPLRFVLPYQKGLRPAWLLRLGLFLYDHLGGRKKLPATRVLDLGKDAAGRPLKPGFRKAFEYSDCRVDDARLVVLNARDAADRGAVIRTRCRLVSAKRQEGGWSLILKDERTGRHEEAGARLVVNATGPWVDKVLADCFGFAEQRHVRLVKGSHIVIRKKFDDPRAYFFQNADGRIFFAIPYEEDFTLIGTTDEDFAGDPHGITISEAEIDYLCAAASGYFAEPVARNDIVWRYAGVRPLFDDGASKAQEATRDYVLKADDGAGGEARLINVFGGKITTYRRLSEAVMAKVEEALGAKGESWTASAKLPGGDFEPTAHEAEIAALVRDFPFLPPAMARRYIRLYGTLARGILGPARSLADLGEHFGSDLYAAEVRYLIEAEWALSAEDILWRRTKEGLRITEPEAIAALERSVAAHHGAEAAPAARRANEGAS